MAAGPARCEKERSLLGFFTRDIGMDLGTASVLVYIKGKGIVLREPSVVAVDEYSHTILAVGEKALTMLGRTPKGISAIRPLKNGVISDYELTERMIHYYLRLVMGRFNFARPRVVVCVPAGVTEVERRSVVEATADAGSMDTKLIEEPVAAAIGAGLPVTKAGGCMVVDIGGGTTDIAVISMSSAVVKESVTIAGDKVDEAIIKHMRRNHNLLIGERTAERIKMQLAVVAPEPPMGAMDVTGRSVLSGLPRTAHIEAAEISQAVEEVATAIIETIHSVLERTPPELASDIYQNGITLTGGGALLGGLCRRVQTELRIPCTLAENPADCVVRGTGMALENMELYGDLVHDYRKPVRYDLRR